MNASKLASKVNKIILKHIRGKGYEEEVILCSPINTNTSGFSIEDEGDTVSNEHEEKIKIVVTAHESDENPTELGDNPIEKLSFIVISDEDLPDINQVKESRIIKCRGKRFKITLVAPARLGGQLIIKECEAEKVI